MYRSSYPTDFGDVIRNYLENTSSTRARSVNYLNYTLIIYFDFSLPNFLIQNICLMTSAITVQMTKIKTFTTTIK